MGSTILRHVPRPSAGLCDACLHQKLIANTRGSVFSLCLRARTDPAYAKYPRLPVAACPGFEPRPYDTGGAGSGAATGSA
jgi:hypothetical protein